MIDYLHNERDIHNKLSEIFDLVEINPNIISFVTLFNKNTQTITHIPLYKEYEENKLFELQSIQSVFEVFKQLIEKNYTLNNTNMVKN